jgi:hypothetical protein
MVADTDGLYVIEGVMPAHYRFAVTALGHASYSQRIAIDASVRKDVVLEPPAKVTGLVLDGDGRPAARAFVVPSATLPERNLRDLMMRIPNAWCGSTIPGKSLWSCCSSRRSEPVVIV